MREKMSHQSKHYISLFFTLLIAIILLDSIYVEANNDGAWSYNNYLSTFQLLAYDDPIIPGQASEISLEIESNTNVEVHIELKGKFTWGDWTFNKVILPIPAGACIITEQLEVPDELLFEETTGCYYYAYVTLPQDSWNPQVWGLVQDVDVSNDSPGFVVDEFPFGPLSSILSAFVALVFLLHRHS